MTKKNKIKRKAKGKTAKKMHVAKKKSAVKSKPKFAKIEKVKVEGLPISQTEAIEAVAETSDTEICCDIHTASVNALEKRTLMAYDAKDIEMLSNSRLPVVAIDKDILRYRDNSALLFLPESNQEFLDDILVCQKICESNNVMLPAIVDRGVEISENVSVPSKQSIEKFLGRYKLNKEGMVSITDDRNTEAMMNISLAMGHAKMHFKKAGDRWKQKFRREMLMVETAGLDDAQVVLVVYGQNSRSAKKAVLDLAELPEEKDRMRVGLIRVHVARPFPKQELQEALELVPKNAKIAVIDSVESAGMAGVIFTEISSITNRSMASFVANKLLSTKNIIDIISKLLSEETTETIWVE